VNAIARAILVASAVVSLTLIAVTAALITQNTGFHNTILIFGVMTVILGTTVGFALLPHD
jgi:hypothetical protein